jgi:hypothetical protein
MCVDVGSSYSVFGSMHSALGLSALRWPRARHWRLIMKVGTYTRLSAPLLGCALLVTSAACGNRTSLLQAADAGVSTDTPAQESSSGNSGGRAGSSTTARAGRGGSAGAGGMAGGRAAMGGRGARAGAGQDDDTEDNGGAGGRNNPRDRDAAADSGDEEPNEEQPTTAGTGGEESAGSGGEQSGAGGEAAGAGGESGEGTAGEDAAGSGGSDSEPEPEPTDAGTAAPEGDRLTGLTSEQASEICGRIESATANLQWTEAVRGWCSRGSLGTPECPASQESCANGATIIPICSETVPDCPDITIEEFVTCRTDVLLSFVEYNRAISCDTPPGLPSEPDVASCVGPYQRCASLAALER